MRNRVERLRIWLLAGAIVLLVILGAFIGYARYLKRSFLARLPDKLGINIVRETNGYTYSQSVQGKTIYTIHAAKAIEHTDGKITLHDVAIVIYGQKQDRADHIYGGEFEYDQKAGLVRAKGLVHIDMQAAPAGGVNHVGVKPAQSLVGDDDAAAHDPKVLHATTSGLVYAQNLGVAATNEYIEFQMGGMTGHATGADYNTDSGLLMLHSAVNLAGIAKDRPFVLNATAAQLDPRDHTDQLTQPRYVSLEQKVQADHATVQTREDGSPERVLAEGNVKSEVDGRTMLAQQADVRLNKAGQPELAVMTGGVLYTSDEPLRQARGEASASTVAFDAHGQPEHAVFMSSIATGAGSSGSPVHMTERMRASEDPREPWSVRDLTATSVELSLAPVAAGKTELRDANAVGKAHLTVVNNGSLKSTAGRGRTDLSADDLKAHLVERAAVAQGPGQSAGRSQHAQNGPHTEIESLTGRGHTVLKQVTADGIEQTSSGDTLDATFRPEAPGQDAGASKRQGMETLESAVQQGHIAMTRHVPGHGPKAADGTATALDESATGERALYDGTTDQLTLTGGVQLAEPGGVVWASRVTFDHGSGDAAAAGGVRVSYDQRAAAPGKPVVPTASSEPVHIVADHADLKHDSGLAIFYGGPAAGKPARMWQGGSQVEAPVIEIEQDQHRLKAHGASGESDGAATVHTVLVNGGDTAKPGAAKAGSPKARPTQVVRVASRELNYSDGLHQAEFIGAVRVEDADGTMLARQATVYLLSGAAKSGAPASDAGLGGSVERVVAMGSLEIAQPGRKATGERLVYTASDGLYVLTGDATAPPKVTDSLHGTSTGAMLEFHAGDESVTILGAVPGAVPGSAAGRVHTEAKVKQEPKVKQ